MTSYSAGDVVLILFPFANGATTKKRPALVVSPAAYAERRGDVVVIAITSVPQPPSEPQIEGWRRAGLLKESWLKPAIASIAAPRVIRKLGTLSEGDRGKARATVAALIAEEFRP
jgi:mRNA interferase MazF